MSGFESQKTSDNPSKSDKSVKSVRTSKKVRKVSDSDSEHEEDNTNSIKNIFIKHMDSIVDRIKNMPRGASITVDVDPPYNRNRSTSEWNKECLIKRNVRFASYIFHGNGSKTIARYFINKTKNEEGFGFQKIIQILNERSFRRFIPIRSWEEFWSRYKTEPIKYRHLFELIRSDQPCKPYLDIEWEVGVNKDARKQNHSKFVSKLQNDLISIFRDRYKIPLKSSEIMLSSSHSEKKVSFHVVINKMIGNKTVAYRTNRKAQPESAWDLWLALIEHDESYEDVLDGAVYTTDREFRVIFSNKTTEFRPFVPYTSKYKGKQLDPDSVVDMSDEECMKYIITHSKNNEYYHIITPKVPSKYAGMSKAIYDPTSFVPPVYTDKTISHLMDLVRKIHPTAEYTGRSPNGGWRFSYRDKNEECYTGNYHESNGFYVFENKDKGTIYMKCMSEECNGIKVLERTVKTVTPIKKLF
jgi:hypothetical protein